MEIAPNYWSKVIGIKLKNVEIALVTDQGWQRGIKQEITEGENGVGAW